MAGLGDLFGSIIKQVIGTAEEQLRARAGLETPPAAATPADATPADATKAPYGMGGKASSIRRDGRGAGALRCRQLPAHAAERPVRRGDAAAASSGGTTWTASRCACSRRSARRLPRRASGCGRREMAARSSAVRPSPARRWGPSPAGPPRPAAILWSRGPYCFSASSNSTDGDVGLPGDAGADRGARSLHACVSVSSMSPAARALLCAGLVMATPSCRQRAKEGPGAGRPRRLPPAPPADSCPASLRCWWPTRPASDTISKRWTPPAAPPST